MIRRSTPALMLALILGLVLATSKVHASVVADQAYDFTKSTRLPWALAFAAMFYIGAYVAGLPDTGGRIRQIWQSAVFASVVGTAGISIAQLAMGSALLPRFVVGTAALGVVPLLVATSLLIDGGRARSSSRVRVLVIGEQEDSTGLSAELEASTERDAIVVGLMSPMEAMPIAGSPAPVVAAADETQATVVVLDREAQARQAIVDQVAILHESGVRVRTLSLFYEEWLGKLPIGELERVSLMFDIGEIHRIRYGRLKRLVDVAFGVCLLPIVGLLIPAVWMANLIGNRGPLFYTQERVGKGGEIFRIVKFRTMRPGGDVSSWTADNDERVTRVGAVLRATHLDELPQAINILKGDLALVGPRPEQPVYVTQLEAKLPFYQLRHLVQPGLTGWAQVKYGYARTELDAMEKLQFEFFYLRHQSLTLDLRILARTARAVTHIGASGG